MAAQAAGAPAPRHPTPAPRYPTRAPRHPTPAPRYPARVVMCAYMIVAHPEVRRCTFKPAFKATALSS